MSESVSQAHEVLIVDDHPFIRSALRMFLENEGIVVDEAGDENEMLQSLKKRRPGVILLDVMLGNIESLSLISKIRQAAPGSKILAMSGYPNLVGSRALQAGADGFMVKGASPLEIAKTVFGYLPKKP